MHLLVTVLAISCIHSIDSLTDSSQYMLLRKDSIDNSICSDFSSDNDDDVKSKYSYGNSSHIRPECESFVREFGERSSRFIKCSVICARPFRFCEGCVVHYMKAKTVFKDIVQDDEKQGNCRRELLNSDRVQVISSIDRDIENIWKTADCERCFSSVTEDENGTVTATLTSETVEFLDAYQNFNNCVPANRTHNQTVCDICEPYYTKMNNLFNEFLNDPESPQHVCMDIVDMMNYTRLLWGRTLDCRNVHYSFGSVIPVAGAFLLIPIIFYISLGVYGTKKIRKIMKQKRLPYNSLSTSYGTLDSPVFTEETESQSRDSAVAVKHDSSIQSDDSDIDQAKERTRLVNGDLQNRKQSS